MMTCVLYLRARVRGKLNVQIDPNPMHIPHSNVDETWKLLMGEKDLSNALDV